MPKDIHTQDSSQQRASRLLLAMGVIVLLGALAYFGLTLAVNRRTPANPDTHFDAENGISVDYESAVWPVCQMTEDAALGHADGAFTLQRFEFDVDALARAAEQLGQFVLHQGDADRVLAVRSRGAWPEAAHQVQQLFGQACAQRQRGHVFHHAVQRPRNLRNP